VPEPYPPLRLSWTRLRNHDECPAKGELVARRLANPMRDTRNFVHGNVCDTAQRRWLAMPEQEPGWMARNVADILEETVADSKSKGDGIIRWRSASDRGDLLAFCRELVTRLEVILNKYCLPYDWSPAWRFEVPASVRYGAEMRKITLVGEIDLLVFGRVPGQIAVWDLKATENDSYWRKTVAQLVFYAIAVRSSKLERLGEWPVRSGLFQPMCTQQVLPVTIGDQAIREMAGRMTRLAGDYWDGRLPAREDDVQCGWCPVRHACPKFNLGAPALTAAR